MTRNELTEMIRKEIQSLAFETLRGGAKEKKDDKNRIFKPKGLSEDELEYAVFYGGDKPEDNRIKVPITIREAYDSGIPKINSSDITEFENSFEQMLQEIEGASVVFDKQSNGYSLKMWIGPDGIDAGASGKIEMGKKGTINWSFSLKNGLTVSAEDVSIEKGNKLVFEKLYNNYNTWQKDWRERLTIQTGKPPGNDMASMEAPMAADAPTEAPAL